MPRISSALSFIPSRRARWALTVLGLLLLGQGAAKAIDPTGYMAALEAFHVLQPAALGPLKLGALALMWTVLELLACVAMLYGGLARAPAKQLTAAGIMVAVGLSAAYLSLDLGAFERHLTVGNSTWFGAYLAQPLSATVLAQEVVLLGGLVGAFFFVRRWPSLHHVARPMRPRALSHA